MLLASGSSVRTPCFLIHKMLQHEAGCFPDSELKHARLGPRMRWISGSLRALSGTKASRDGWGLNVCISISCLS